MSPGLPDTSKVKVVARIRAPETPGGFHNLFAYKHSDGRVLLFTTTTSNVANVYDLRKVVAGDTAHQLVGKVPVPPSNARGEVLPGFSRSRFCSRDITTSTSRTIPARGQDKFYGAGGGGYYVYDVTKPEEPKLITSIVGAAGIAWGHTFTPTPDGNFAVTETEYQWAPLRHLRSPPGPRGQGPDRHAASIDLERRLERPRAQPRGPLATRVRVGLRGRPAGLQHGGPGAPEEQGLVPHV